MRSILISSKDKEKALGHALSFCQNKGIDKIDMDIVYGGKQTGIEDIRNLKKKIFLKPIKSDAKAIIMEASLGLTIEAQNAMLKILEEPPENTIIIVIVSASRDILPTIISRCKVIELPASEEKLNPNEFSILNSQLLTLLKGKIGDRLKLASDFGKSREETIVLLEKMIIAERKNILDIIQSSNGGNIDISGNLRIIKNFQKTHTAVKTTNVNQRLALENLFLKLN